MGTKKETSHFTTFKSRTRIGLPAATNTTSGFQRAEVSASSNPVAATEVSGDASRRAADGFLVNGSVNNAASSPFSQIPAFGNNRAPGRWRYNGNFGFMMDNSPLDARPFSLTGQNTPRLAYNRFTGLATLGGPIRIPGLHRNGPQFTLNYQWTRNRNVASQSALMPTVAERVGDFSQTFTPQGQPVQLNDPSTGLPLPGNRIPLSRISPQAQTLLSLYPLPNFDGQARYNFQVPLVSSLHQDSMQFRAVRQLGRKNNLSGTLQLQSSRTDNPNLFGFLTTGSQLTDASTVNWRHTFSSQFFLNLGYQFSRSSARNVPFFSKRFNVSGAAGITGNYQDPLDWGPPSLNFANGIAALGESQYSSTRNQTHGLSAEVFRARSRHNVTSGFDFRRQQWNTLSQQDPRGTFTFTGAAAGSDLAGFLFGVPDTASLAFGNADKYFRANSWDAYISDDWRFRSGFSLTLGVRYEYNSPIAELYGRLVNLAVANHFASTIPIVARSAGPLIQPDRNNIAPRLGFAWRPFPTSTMIVRGGYGIYYDSPVYQSIATQMAQQAPLSTSLRVENSAANPLTLAEGFRGSPNIINTTFGIDPRFRDGYAQNWQLSAQRDLRFALQMVATYLGIKGTGALLREWTVVTQLNVSTGLPLTPTSFSSVRGTGVTGSIRANYTGADPYDAPAGLHLNPAAYAAPAPDQWGNAGRNTITGPAQFSLNASAGRTFRWGDHLTADLRVDATNALNHPVFPSWNTVISSAQFGLPNPAGQMRTLQTTLRVRF